MLLDLEYCTSHFVTSKQCTLESCRLEKKYPSSYEWACGRVVRVPDVNNCLHCEELGAFFKMLDWASPFQRHSVA
jgi:hypothetical protein